LAEFFPDTPCDGFAGLEARFNFIQVRKAENDDQPDTSQKQTPKEPSRNTTTLE
jgi:hypothetical protein